MLAEIFLLRLQILLRRRPIETVRDRRFVPIAIAAG